MGHTQEWALHTFHLGGSGLALWRAVDLPEVGVCVGRQVQGGPRRLALAQLGGLGLLFCVGFCVF